MRNEAVRRKGFSHQHSGTELIGPAPGGPLISSIYYYAEFSSLFE